RRKRVLPRGEKAGGSSPAASDGRIRRGEAGSAAAGTAIHAGRADFSGAGFSTAPASSSSVPTAVISPSPRATLTPSFSAAALASSYQEPCLTPFLFSKPQI